MVENNVIKDFMGINESKPYERCLALGPAALSDAQLLAVILRTGTNGIDATNLAEKIIQTSKKKGFGCSFLGIYHMTTKELMSIKGIGKVKAIQIQCVCELAKRIAKQKAGEKLNFSSPESIANYYMQDLRHLDKEHLVLVLLDNKCNFIKDCVISMGTVNASLVNPREILIEAIKHEAVWMILIHNHPSGDVTPSRNDLEVTNRIKKAGEIIGISLIDHIIIGDNIYTSLKEKDYI